jgi:ketosteroid isomerase-like protein
MQPPEDHPFYLTGEFREIDPAGRLRRSRLGPHPVPEESPTPGIVELAQRWIDAVNAGDVDAATSLFAPDIVWEGVFQTFEGRAAARGFIQDWVDAHDEFELVAEEVRDLGGGVAFSVFIQRGRPRGATGWVQFRAASVTIVVDGLAERAAMYLDVDQARAAAERLADERK